MNNMTIFFKIKITESSIEVPLDFVIEYMTSILLVLCTGGLLPIVK